MDTGNYNSVGISQTGPAMNQSPSSNSGIVYQPANTPTNPGALKVARQTSENIKFLAKDGGYVNIGTIDTSPATTAGSAGIEIFGPNGDLIWFIGDAEPVALQISGAADRNTPIPLVSITDSSLQEDAALSIEVKNFSDGLDIAVEGSGVGLSVTNNGTGTNNLVEIINSNASNTNSPLEIGSNAVISSHFLKLLNLQSAGAHSIHLYTSDGTTPNLVLSGNVGDVCLWASATGQMARCTGTTNWTLI
jgi:hypothetical protein